MKKDFRPAFDFETNRWADSTSPSTAAPLTKRRSTDEDQAEPAEGFWTAPAQKSSPNRLWLYVPVWLTIIVSLTISLSINPLLLSTTIAPIILSVVIARRKEEILITEKDLRLLEDADDHDVCLVQAKIYRNLRVVGSDHDVVWFENGLLLFSGHRTSFAIGGQDILPTGASYRNPPLPDRFLPLRVFGGSAQIELTPPQTGRRRPSDRGGNEIPQEPLRIPPPPPNLPQPPPMAAFQT